MKRTDDISVNERKDFKRVGYPYLLYCKASEDVFMHYNVKSTH